MKGFLRKCPSLFRISFRGPAIDFQTDHNVRLWAERVLCSRNVLWYHLFKAKSAFLNLCYIYVIITEQQDSENTVNRYNIIKPLQIIWFLTAQRGESYGYLKEQIKILTTYYQSTINWYFWFIVVPVYWKSSNDRGIKRTNKTISNSSQHIRRVGVQGGIAFCWPKATKIVSIVTRNFQRTTKKV